MCIYTFNNYKNVLNNLKVMTMKGQYFKMITANSYMVFIICQALF